VGDQLVVITSIEKEASLPVYKKHSTSNEISIFPKRKLVWHKKECHLNT
jgi:hypothetical protein